MKKVKVITKNAELEEFLARTDIEIINVDIMSCEQSCFAQEYFTATVYYDDEPKSDYIPDYWTRLEHTYAGMAMQGILSCPEWNIVPREGVFHAQECALQAQEFAHALVKKMKEVK